MSRRRSSWTGSHSVHASSASKPVPKEAVRDVTPSWRRAIKRSHNRKARQWARNITRRTEP